MTAISAAGIAMIAHVAGFARIAQVAQIAGIAQVALIAQSCKDKKMKHFKLRTDLTIEVDGEEAVNWWKIWKPILKTMCENLEEN